MWRSRRLTYRERGAVRFTRAERRSYALMVDVRFLSVVGTPYTNLKSNPPESFYGKYTVFHGSLPAEISPLPTPYFRVLNLRNEQSASTYNALALAADANRQITGVGELVEAVWARLQGIQLAPLLDHRPNFLKVVGLPLSQFEIVIWRLEFEDGVGFELPNPYPDPTRGGDQYPEPRQNSVDAPYAGNPPESPRPSFLDERDFAEEEPDPGTFTGNLNYEYLTPSGTEYLPLTQEGVMWPGQLVTLALPNRPNSIVWEDDQGVQTPMTTFTAGFRAEVRFVEFEADDGTLFIPDPNTATIGP